MKKLRKVLLRKHYRPLSETQTEGLFHRLIMTESRCPCAIIELPDGALEVFSITDIWFKPENSVLHRCIYDIWNKDKTKRIFIRGGEYEFLYSRGAHCVLEDEFGGLRVQKVIHFEKI